MGSETKVLRVLRGVFVVEKRLVEVFEEWWRWMSGGDWKSQSLLVDGGEESGSRDIIRINQMLKGVFVWENDQ